jgi:hypothetical protein
MTTNEEADNELAMYLDAEMFGPAADGYYAFVCDFC